MKNNTDFFKNSRQILKKENIFESGDGVSYSKIPRNLFDLKAHFDATTSDILIALILADYSVNSRYYPSFSLERSKIAKMAGLSERQVSISIQKLTLNNVLFVSSRMGEANVYTWNEDFLKGREVTSQGVVKSLHEGGRNDFTRGSEVTSHIYIELSLEIFISSFKEFFAEYQAPYNFYVPAKRNRNNDEPKGSTIQVSRKEAWREAAFYVYEKIKHYDDALPRIYLGLMASKNIEDVRYPKKALFYRVTDSESIHISRSRSHIAQYLYSNEDFMEFYHMKKGGHYDESVRGL